MGVLVAASITTPAEAQGKKPAAPAAKPAAAAPAAKPAAAAAKPAAAAAAAPAKAGPAKKINSGKLDMKEITAALESSDASRIETALVNVRMAGKDGGGKAATALVVQRLKNGLPRELLKKALDTLTDVEDPEATEGCALYMAHRDPDIRLSALKCLGEAASPEAVLAIRAALGDVDPRVHSTAATLLGETKATAAVPDLIVALDKGVNEAAVSIGQLCDAKAGECDQLLNRMKSKPLDVISSGLQQILARKDVPDDYKKKIITQVRELASAKAREFLEGVKKTWPPNGSKVVGEALDKAIKDLEGAK